MQRTTKQRQAIQTALDEARRPLSPEEVLRLAEPHCPGLGQATVYRNLNKGVEDGWLVRVEMPGRTMVLYELANLGHHHHFECMACHKVFDVPGCPGGISELTPPGFRLDRHEISLYGLCDECNTLPSQ